MNEVTTNEVVRLAAEINYIKQDTARRVLDASVEIGRRLTEAKEKVPQGEWLSWLESSVSYSERTARNLMRLYREYGDETVKELFTDNQLAILGGMEPCKALALAALPVPDRKEYIETHDVSAESTRQIEEAVKAMKEAQAAQMRAEADLTAEREISQRNARSIADLEEQLKAAKSAAPDAEQIREQVQKEYADELKKTSKAARSDRKGREEAEAEVAKLKESITKMEAEAEGIRTEIQAEYEAKMAQQAAELERKYRAMQSAALQKFSVLFELLQRQLSECTAAFAKVRNEVPDKVETLVKAYNGVLEGNLLKEATDESDT